MRLESPHRRCRILRRNVVESVTMETKDQKEALDRVCQGVSPTDEPCNLPATVHCVQCSQWFCDVHAEDDQWHSCMLVEGEEGGEA